MAEHIFFNGQKYSKAKTGYWRSTSREHKKLHVAVWEFHHGEVPKGYDIHHIDGNPSNNAIENLQCLSHSDHLRIHAKERHEAGTFASKNERNVVKICAQCGKKFLACRVTAKFCSQNCCQNWQRVNGCRYEKRVCAVCGRDFVARRDTPTKYCSGICAAIGNGTAKLTNDQRDYIRRVYKPRDKNFSGVALARKFNVSASTISDIINEE